MKKIIKIFFLLSVFSFGFSYFTDAESIKDSEYYKQALDIFNNAKAEFERGDYDKGYALSEDARTLLNKANEDNVIKSFIVQIEAAKKDADEKISKAKELGAEKKDELAKKIAKATELFGDGDKRYSDGKAKTEYKDKSGLFQESLDFFTESGNWAKQVLSELSAGGDAGKAEALLVEANAKRSSLLTDKVISENDEKDKDIKGFIDEGKKAFDAGDYSDSIKESQSAIAMMDRLLNKDREEAKALIAEVKAKLASSKENSDEAKNADKLKSAENALSDAEKFYQEDNFKESVANAKKALGILEGIDGDLVFPRYYTVRLIPDRRDCLWRIAEKDFAYNDGYKWTILYQKNKIKLAVPANPDLIYPEVIIELPSINGEMRKGMYDPKKKYPKFDPKKNYGKK